MDYLAIVTFAFVSSITPGPNNLMLWASGMNYGFRRTLPHMIGVNLGFMSLLAASALGHGALIQSVPWISPLLWIVGSLYLTYLAYRVATAGEAKEGTTSKPFTFWEAAAFQYVNPKAWVMGLTAASTFVPASLPLVRSSLLMVGTFGLVNLPSITAWAAGGTAMNRFMTNDKRRRIVNGILGLLLIYTVYLINT